MCLSDLKKIIEQGLPDSTVMINSNDNSHFYVEIICPHFSGKSRLQQNKMVNAIVAPYIRSGEVHAISLKMREK